MSPPPPPPPLCLPFQRQRQKQLTQHSNDSASTASTVTLTSITSAATKLQFTEDTDSYYVPVKEKPTHRRRGSEPIPQLPTRSNSYPPKALSPPIRLWQWGRRWDDSVTTLVGNNEHWKQNDTTSDEKADTTLRLRALRTKMADEHIDYFIIPSEDGHLSEYTAPSERRREWISGFRGSAGTAIISKHSAYLFTDSRYWIQAQRELDANWSLQKVGWQGTKDWLEWVILSPRGSKIGIDSRMICHERATRLFKGLYDRGSKLVHPRQNLIDLVWDDRPKRPKDTVYVQPEEYAGKGAREKLSDIRKWIRSQNAVVAKQAKRSDSSNSTTTTTSATSAGVSKGPTNTTNVSRQDTKLSNKTLVNSSPSSSPPLSNPNEKISAMFVSSLSGVAHTLNLRGSDVPYNPVFTAYLLVALDKTVLFIDLDKISSEVKKYLYECGVSLRGYADVWTYLRNREWGDGKVIISPNTPYAVSLIIGSSRYVVLPSFVEEQKAVKNECEIEGFRNAYLKDGAAMCRWFAWLDHKFRTGFEISEWEASEKLNDFRKEMPLYMGLAYETISASGPNAALPHYTPSRLGASPINRDTPYLIDSGGQYRNGTCDTTRTVHFGYPTAEQCEAFTRVLQGHIAIETAVFPAGTSGAQLDVLARKSLWKDGLNYLHGTGHGIGSFLTVHEGPQSFGNPSVALEPGHVLTNEPGYYKEGHWGMRIESTLVVKRVDTKGQFGGDCWLGFERFTQVPIQTKLIKASLLSKEERNWVKEHNRGVLRVLEPYLDALGDKRAVKWLKRECTRAFGNEGKGSGGISIEWD